MYNILHINKLWIIGQNSIIKHPHTKFQPSFHTTFGLYGLMAFECRLMVHAFKN